MGRFDDDDNFDDDDEDGGTFADSDDIFEDGIADAEEGPEGSFRDDTSVFSTPQSSPEPHSNPLTTKEQEIQQYETPKNALERARDKGVLVGKWMSSRPGDFMVAWTLKGKRVEAWRAPTRAEFDKFKARGRFVKGGLKQSVGADVTIDAQTGFGGFWQKHKKKVLWGGGVAAVLGGGYWLFQHWNELFGGEEVEDGR